MRKGNEIRHGEARAIGALAAGIVQRLEVSAPLVGNTFGVGDELTSGHRAFRDVAFAATRNTVPRCIGLAGFTAINAIMGKSAMIFRYLEVASGITAVSTSAANETFNVFVGKTPADASISSVTLILKDDVVYYTAIIGKAAIKFSYAPQAPAAFGISATKMRTHDCSGSPAVTDSVKITPLLVAMTEGSNSQFAVSLTWLNGARFSDAH